jgi:2-methylaconitate cis-trans-isomerase PrpF
MDQPNQKIKLCNLYKRQTKNGDDYFFGKYTASSNIVIFKNSYKKEEKDADYVLYLQPSIDKPKVQQTSEVQNLEDVPF